MIDPARILKRAEAFERGELTNGKGSAELSHQARFPLEIFPQWLRRYAWEVAAACEVPADVVGFTMLGMLSAAYGTHLQIAFKHGYVRFCHDYFFLVADVSLGKSGVFEYLSSPLYAIQNEIRNSAQASSDDKRAPRPQCVISDATPEALVKVQYENGGAVAMISPETPLLAQLSATGRNQWPVAPYNCSHTGDPYYVHRITRGPNEIDRARLAIMTATQPGALKQVQNRPELESTGFIARCTFFIVPPLTIDDLHPGDPEVSEALQARYKRTIQELGTHYRRTDALPLCFSREAAQSRIQWIDAMRLRYKIPGGDLHSHAGHCAKLEEKVSRWAGLLHVLWCAEEGRVPGELTVEDWGRGLSIYDFAFQHFQAALHIMAEGPADALAKVLRELCKRYQGKRLTYRLLRRNCAAFKAADDRTQEAAILELEDDGVLRRIDNTNEGGRPSPAVEVL